MHMGTLPSELGNTGLAQLALESNEFTGTTPETYLNLPLGKSLLIAYRVQTQDENVFLSIVEVLVLPCRTIRHRSQ
jgi:hypothetical protein